MAANREKSALWTRVFSITFFRIYVEIAPCECIQYYFRTVQNVKSEKCGHFSLFENNGIGFYNSKMPSATE